jgi:hypothetical protein
LIAWIMFMVAGRDHAVLAHMPAALRSSRIICACSFRCQGISSNTSSNIVSNGWCSPSAEDAVLLGLPSARADLLGDLAVHRGMALLVPFAERDEVRLQPLDRIAERPFAARRRRTIFGRIVRGRMALGAVGEMLDQGRALIGARALGGP